MTIEQLLQNEIDKIYGFEKGEQTGKVLIPAFLGDFKKVLEDGAAGSVISEEYMTEDKKLHLIFHGLRRIGSTGFDSFITSCECNGKEIVSSEIPIKPVFPTI